MAESELHRATAEATHASKLLEEQIDSFEKRKLSDIKKILLDFVNIEMLFHAKALEMYTKAYNCVFAIDEENDIEMFRNCLRTPALTSRLETVRSAMEATNHSEDTVHSISLQASNFKMNSGEPSNLQSTSRIQTSFEVPNSQPKSNYNASAGTGDNANGEELDKEAIVKNNEKYVSIFRKR